MSSSALVSFTIRPGAGSEAGVGWAFLEAMLDRPGRVHLVLDERDADAVLLGLARRSDAGRVVVHDVPVPAPVLRRYGDRRTRESYLAWLPAARRRLRSIGHAERLAVAHQVTFASAVLPPVLQAHVAGRVVWGPLSIPASATAGVGRIAPLGAAAVGAAQTLAARNVRRADLVVANNDHSARFIERLGGDVVIEPNIVAEPAERAEVVDESRLVIAGHLVARKRPWLAVRAMADARLADRTLLVLGDGPLLADLRDLAERVGVADRVRFAGAVGRADALDAMATSRLLVHPSAREGSPWVVGEAAAHGTAAVVMPGSGAEATVRLCENGGAVAPDLGSGREVEALVDGVVEALGRPQPDPSARWSAARLPGLLDRWYDSSAPRP